MNYTLLYAVHSYVFQVCSMLPHASSSVTPFISKTLNSLCYTISVLYALLHNLCTVCPFLQDSFHISTTIFFSIIMVVIYPMNHFLILFS